jgi:hypothetical protein
MKGRRQQNPLCLVMIVLHLVPYLILDSFGHHLSIELGYMMGAQPH